MSEGSNRNDHGADRRRPPLWPGVTLTLLGGVGVGVVLAADIGGTPELEALAFKLGLAWAPLLLGFAQAALLTGLWLIWRARHTG